jgi:hypothetical protein
MSRSRKGIRFSQPVANPPFCWLCDRRLYAGGRSYVTIVGEDGHPRPAHDFCAGESSAEVESRRGGEGDV